MGVVIRHTLLSDTTHRSTKSNETNAGRFFSVTFCAERCNASLYIKQRGNCGENVRARSPCRATRPVALQVLPEILFDQRHLVGLRELFAGLERRGLHPVDIDSRTERFAARSGGVPHDT